MPQLESKQQILQTSTLLIKELVDLWISTGDKSYEVATQEIQNSIIKLLTSKES